jgi:hypothetical protein
LQLSILLPSHRSGLTAISRIAQVCSWAGPNIEVIVRDNSGDANKRDLIARFQSENCKVISADPCAPLENFSALIRLAKGDFIFCPADDDFSFDRAIRGMPDILEKFSKDSSVVGITGRYAIEASAGSAIAAYRDVDSNDPVARVSGFLSNNGPNVLFYSALRRQMVERVYDFLTSMPFYLSFHDQIQSLLFLLCGKFIQLPRLLYAYDMGVWETRETAQRRDMDYFAAAGLDPVMNILQWFLCAFEGAVLIRNSGLFPDHPLAQRQAIADRWFSVRFAAFVGDKRSAFGSKFEAETEKIRGRLMAPTGQLSFQALLVEICDVIALFSGEKAKVYYDFWDAQINRGGAFRHSAPNLAQGSAA